MVMDSLNTVEAPACYLCNRYGDLLYEGVRDRLFEAPGVWSMRSCSRCGLCWLDPRPGREDLKKIYTGYYTHRALPQPVGIRPRFREWMRDSTISAVCGYSGATPGSRHSSIGRVLSGFGPFRDAAAASVRWLGAGERGRLLDVGCGNGTFLAYMRRLGWEVEGVDPDPAAVQAAHEESRLRVACGTVEEVGLPADHFDAVTMSHVIEHVPDPVGTLAGCRRVLRPGGQIVVITPNVRSLARHWFGDSWRGWEVPRHFFVFSVGALKECAERAGLRVQELRTTARFARFMWSASHILRRDGVLPGGEPRDVPWPLRLEGMFFWMVEHLLARSGPRGEEILMIARKE